MAIKIEMLRCFATVARSGNLVNAADRLARTPSAVSMTLKQFQAHLGAPLFEAGRKSKLTPLGTFVYDEAVLALERFDNTVSAIERYADSQSGFVRVAAVPSVAEAVLPRVVEEFLQLRPDVRIDIRDMDSMGVLRELERERVDIGLATSIDPGADIECVRLFSDAFGIVCRMDHPLTEEKQPLNWRALEPWPFIANGVCVHIIDDVFQKILANSTLSVRNTTSLMAMVRAGIGVTALPRLVVDDTDSTIRFIPVTDHEAMRHIDILKRTHVSLSPAAREFESAVRRTVQALSADWQLTGSLEG